METDEQGLNILFENAKKMKEEGRQEEAIKELEKIIELAPRNLLAAKAAKDIGDIYSEWQVSMEHSEGIDIKDNEKAVQYYLNAIKIDPNNLDAYYALGSTYSNLQNRDGALEQYNKVLNSNPNDELKADCLLGIGNIYLNQEKLDDALREFSKIVELNLDDNRKFMALDSIGILYIDKGEYNKAIDYINKFFESFPNNEFASRVFSGIGEYCNDMKKYGDAENSYKEAIKYDPRNYSLHEELAYLYEKIKENEKAKIEWTKCLIYAKENGEKEVRAKNHLIKKLEVSEKEIEMIKSEILKIPSKTEPIEEKPEKPPQDNGFLMDTLIKKTFLPTNFFMKITDLLEEKPQLIFYGVPGTGKTFVAKEFAKYFTNCASEADLKNQFQLIQFHQSYSYEEFIEGIRPETIETASGKREINYSVQDGIFKKFCKKAKEKSNEKFLLIIDEINRGNISKIFGELLYLLEYRDEPITLPYSKKPFNIPKNVYIIGTMNTADRSIAFVDYALRRRFYFVEFQPKMEVLEKWLNENPDKRSGIDVLKLFTTLNDKIKNDLDEHHRIGHSYFMIENGILDENRLKLIWDYNIMPLLKEYFFTKTNLDNYSFDSMIKG